jgi:transcriptional antiterminator
MKNDNTEKLIFLLSNTNHHLSGEELAKMLHVSKRSIRNYIKEINSGEQYHIESNQKGYLMSFSGSSLRTEHTHQEDRIWQILDLSNVFFRIIIAYRTYASRRSHLADLG